MSDLVPNQNNFILYTTPEGAVKLNVLLENETIWLTQEQMSQLFDRERSVITKHIANVFREGELEEKSNVQILHISDSDKPVKFYNLDVIISVGYRVKSQKGTRFRIWATKTLKDYIIKGFVLDDNRLKQGEALFVLRQIKERLSACKLTLHPEKTKIVNLRGTAEKKYPKSYDFLGFTIRPQWCKVKTRSKLLPSIFISRKSESSILEKFRKLNIHKRRGTIEALAAEIKPMLKGIINYYCKFSTGHLRKVCNQLTKRLMKWVQWEKGLHVMASIKWLRTKHRENSSLFPHWVLVHP